MTRYYSDSDDPYYVARAPLDKVRTSGWQTPLPTTTTDAIPSSKIIRLVVECPFGSKKCDFVIDKSQIGRLSVTARRRPTFKSDYFSTSNKNNEAIQTFTIPYDADVDNLKTYIERYTNSLIIEIPRLSSSSQFIRDDRKYFDNNRKLEYRVDCHGYTAGELDVYIQDRDLIVQGKTLRTRSPDPTQQYVSRNFRRKISLPNSVDLSKVVSYLENGELRIEAPLKREIYYSDNRAILPEYRSTTVPSRRAIEFNRIQSPTSSTHQHHYRRHERVSRHRALSPTRRVYSAESLHYPYYRTLQDFDNDGDDEDDSRENRYRQTTHSPTSNIVRTTTTRRYYPADEEVYFRY